MASMNCAAPDSLECLALEKKGLLSIVAISLHDLCCCLDKVSLVAQMVKNLPAVQETRVRSLGWKDALEKGMATESNILAWRIPWTEEPGGLQPMGSQESDTNDQLTH